MNNKKSDAEHLHTIQVQAASALERIGLKSLIEAEGLQVVDGPADLTVVSLGSTQDLARIQGVADTSRAVAVISEPDLAADVVKQGIGGLLLREKAEQLLLPAIRSAIEGRFFLDDTLLQASPEGNRRVTGVPIVGTKLHRPLLPPDLVPRPELIERLDGVRRRPFVLLSAPTGFGKSLLASDWLESSDWPAAWISLDDSDSDLHRFLTYVLSAIQKMAPESCAESKELLQAAPLPEARILHAALSNDMDAIATPFFLVLDDYHRIDPSSPVHELLDLLLERPPIPLHLIMTTRRDPPLSMSRLRANGQILEIRMRDLMFDREQARSLIQNLSGTSLPDDVLDKLQKSMEGWPVALRLLGVAAARQQNPTRFIEAFYASDESISDHLIREILLSQPGNVQSWLLKSSILERFCADLAEAVCSDPTGSDGLRGGDFINHLRAEGLPILALDGRYDWLRYHHAFEELLRERLVQSTAPAEVAELHLKASAWYEQKGLIEEAIDHALMVADEDRAAKIIEAHKPEHIRLLGWRTVEGWLNRLPERCVAENPGLLIATGWVAQAKYDLPGLERVHTSLRDIDLSSLDSDNRKLALSMSAFSAYSKGAFLEAAELWGEAFEQTPGEQGMLDVYLAFSRSMALRLGNRREEAYAWVESLGDRVDPKHQGFHGVIPLGRVRLLLQDDEHRELRARSRQNDHSPQVSPRLAYPLGCSFLRTFELEAAERYFSSVAHRHAMTLDHIVDLSVGEAITLELLGRHLDADRVLEDLQRFVGARASREIASTIDSSRARLALLRADLQQAHTLMAQAEPPFPTEVTEFVELPTLTRISVLIAVGSSSALEQAGKLYGQAEKLFGHVTSRAIDLAVLKSRLLHRSGDRPGAESAFARALALAAPNGVLLPFVEPGTDMDALIGDFPPDLSPNTDLLARIRKLRSARNEATDSPPESRDEGIEPLTNREEQILTLLAQRLQNKQIADKLFVSTETVKTHLKHLYKKLGVSNRREAVERGTDYLEHRRY